MMNQWLWKALCNGMLYSHERNFTYKEIQIWYLMIQSQKCQLLGDPFQKGGKTILKELQYLKVYQFPLISFWL